MTSNLHDGIKRSLAIAPQIQTNADTAIVSTILDTLGAEENELVIALGTLTDADVTLTVLIEDGDNSALSDNAAVDDAFLQGVEAMGLRYDSDLKTAKIGYFGRKRYIRATITPSGNGAGALPIAAIWEQRGLRKLPVSSQVN